jgi:ketosteroid isomerase-like protein
MDTPSSRANVAVVTRAYEAFKRRDFAAIFELLASDVEILQSVELPWGGAFRGHAGAREFLAKLMGAIDLALTFERLLDAGDSVVAIGRAHGKVNDGGARYDVPVAHVWTIEDERVTRVAFYVDNAAMLAALQPLDPQTMPRDEGPVDEAG